MMKKRTQQVFGAAIALAFLAGLLLLVVPAVANAKAWPTPPVDAKFLGVKCIKGESAFGLRIDNLHPRKEKGYNYNYNHPLTGGGASTGWQSANTHTIVWERYDRPIETLTVNANTGRRFQLLYMEDIAVKDC